MLKPIRLAVALSCLMATTLLANERDPEGYQRVLIPLVTNQDLPGAYGSLWRTELVVRNEAAEPVQIFQSECFFFCSCFVVTECPQQATPANSLYIDGVFVSDLIRNDGAFIYIQRRYSDQVAFAARLRDISRNAESAGTAVPVVREEQLLTTTTAHLLDVPNDPRFRVHLRIYGVASPSGAGDVLVRIYALDSNAEIAEVPIAIRPYRYSGGRIPPPEQHDNQPGFAEIANLGDAIGSTTVDRLRVDVIPVTPGLIFWAMITVTNNQTQQVMTVTPQ